MDEKTKDEIRLEYDNKMKAIIAQNEELTARVDRADIEKWLDNTVNAEGVKVLPAEREEVVEFALQAIRDDRAAHPTMKSADGGETTRLDAFKKSIEMRAVKIPVDEASRNLWKAAMFPQQTKNDPTLVSEQRKAELLAMTDLGKEALAEKKNGRG